jgi:hypothetical protein
MIRLKKSTIVLIIAMFFSRVASAPVSNADIFIDFSFYDYDIDQTGNTWEVEQMYTSSVNTYGAGLSSEYHTEDLLGYTEGSSIPDASADLSLYDFLLELHSFSAPLQGSSSAFTAFQYDQYFRLEELTYIYVSMDFTASVDLTTDNPGDYAQGISYGQVSLYLWPEDQEEGSENYTLLSEDQTWVYAHVRDGDDYSFSTKETISVSSGFSSDQPFSGQLRAVFSFYTEAVGSVEHTSVPEPDTKSLFALGICAVFFSRKIFHVKV